MIREVATEVRGWGVLIGCALAGLVSLLLAPVVRADIVQRVIAQDEQGRWVERAMDDNQNPQSDVVENYDNWRRSNRDGHTVFFGDYRVGGNEIGDDMQLVDYSGGIMDNLGFSRVNLSSS